MPIGPPDFALFDIARDTLKKIFKSCQVKEEKKNINEHYEENFFD